MSDERAYRFVETPAVGFEDSSKDESGNLKSNLLYLVPDVPYAKAEDGTF
jgi:hypothetical protein